MRAVNHRQHTIVTREDGRNEGASALRAIPCRKADRSPNRGSPSPSRGRRALLPAETCILKWGVPCQGMEERIKFITPYPRYFVPGSRLLDHISEGDSMNKPENANPCCAEQQNYIFRGAFCRCCGERLRGQGSLVFCDRREIGNCPYCGRLTCGAHANDARGSMPPRRYCEFEGCGKRCEDDGRCREQHEYREAAARRLSPD